MELKVDPCLGITELKHLQEVDDTLESKQNFEKILLAITISRLLSKLSREPKVYSQAGR